MDSNIFYIMVGIGILTILVQLIPLGSVTKKKETPC
jgi:hypothetical protein